MTDLTIAYGSHRVIDGATAGFARGTASGIIGPNGAGKSTLLKGICGALPAVRGTISLDGVIIDPRSNEWRRRATMIPDDNALFPDLTVDEHFELVSLLFDLDARESLRRRESLVELFDLDRLRGKEAHELSFGFRKRLAIALSLCRDADLFLFDEPFVGLDVASLGLFREVISLLTASSRIVLIASHVITVVRELCGEVLALERGMPVQVTAGTEHDGELGEAVRPVELPWIEPVRI